METSDVRNKIGTARSRGDKLFSALRAEDILICAKRQQEKRNQKTDLQSPSLSVRKTRAEGREREPEKMNQHGSGLIA